MPAFGIDRILHTGGTFITQYYFVIFLLIPLLYTFVALNILRIWLLYFDINITKFNLQKAWQSVMDPMLETQNWFKQHEQTYGNAIFLIKYCLLFVIFFSTTSGLLRTFNLITIERIMSWIITLALTICAIIIWFKLKHFHIDHLGIRREMVAIFRIGCFFFITGIIILALRVSNVISENLYNIIWGFNVCIGLTALTIITTLYPKKLSQTGTKMQLKSSESSNSDICSCMICNCNCNCKVFVNCNCPCVNKIGDILGANEANQLGSLQKTNELNKNIELVFDKPKVNVINSTSNSNSLQMPSSVSSVSPSINEDNFGNLWSDIVCTPFGYESLMNHLKNELSIENLLFISEVYICLCVYLLRKKKNKNQTTRQKNQNKAKVGKHIVGCVLFWFGAV